MSNLVFDFFKLKFKVFKMFKSLKIILFLSFHSKDSLPQSSFCTVHHCLHYSIVRPVLYSGITALSRSLGTRPAIVGYTYLNTVIIEKG